MKKPLKKKPPNKSVQVKRSTSSSETNDKVIRCYDFSDEIYLNIKPKEFLKYGMQKYGQE